MGTCESVDGKALPGVNNQQECWQKGGAKWKPAWVGQSPIMNPNLPAAVSTLQPQSSDAAKAVADAKTAQTTAIAATAAAAKADATATTAAQSASNAAAAADDARNVRDKCIKAANDAHKKAVEACGPELGAKKEGFGSSEGMGCGMWLLLIIIVLVFVAICMQNVDKSAPAVKGEFEINSALI